MISPDVSKQHSAMHRQQHAPGLTETASDLLKLQHSQGRKPGPSRESANIWNVSQISSFDVTSLVLTSSYRQHFRSVPIRVRFPKRTAQQIIFDRAPNPAGSQQCTIRQAVSSHAKYTAHLHHLYYWFFCFCFCFVSVSISKLCRYTLSHQSIFIGNIF